MKFNSLFVEFSFKNRIMYKLRNQMVSVQLNDINKELINKYGIDIMPGGGLSFLNLDKLIEKLGALEAVHGTKIVDIK